MAFYCSTMLSMALELAQRGPDLRGHGLEVLRALRRHRRCDERARRHRALGRGRRLLLRPALDRRTRGAAADPIDGRPAAAVRGRSPRPDGRSTRCQASRSGSTGSWPIVRTSPGTSRAWQPSAHHGPHRLLAIPSRERLERVLRYMLDEQEFLSPFGIRSVSRIHESHPFILRFNGDEHRLDYTPGESNTGLFGGNSNWRGPIWLPLNFLLVEALERYHHFYGNAFTVECPTGSGRHLTLEQVAREISRRVASLFLRDASGHRPCFGTERAVCRRSALAGPDAVPRVFPRRDRAWLRGQPSDGMDGAGGAVHRRAPGPTPYVVEAGLQTARHARRLPYNRRVNRAAVVVLFVLASATSFAQSPSPSSSEPAFEVTSVKPNRSGVVELRLDDASRTAATSARTSRCISS